MLARSLVRRIVPVRSIASTSSDPSTRRKKEVQNFSPVVPLFQLTVDEVAQNLLAAPPSRLPKPIFRLRAAWRNRMNKNVLDPMLKSLLDSASTQLYYNCANNYDYEKLCEAFGLPDYMSTWYKLTLMHCWMVLTRMHTSLDAYAYLRLQRSLLATLWLDVDNRLKIVSEEVKLTLTNRADMKKMHGLHLQTFLEYDEGFLADDRMFAAAIWRCLYMSRSFDPIHVLKVIAYMRSTLAWLDMLDLNEILVDGIKEWKQVKPKEASQEPATAEIDEEKKKSEVRAS